MKKVLILGGGFAGVKAAIQLQKSKKFDVTLVSDRDYLFLYPISIWIPVRTLNFEDAKVPLSKIQKKHGFRLLIEKVKHINAAGNQVILDSQTLQYDYLIVAFGAGKMQPKGIENTGTICGHPDQTFEFRNQLDKLIAKGSGKIAIGFGGNPKDKSAVRGGPAFELAFNVHHYLKKKHLRENFEITMFAPMDQPGAKMGKKALAMMNMLFRKQNIKTAFGKKITEFTSDGIIFEDDSKLTADLVMFIAAGTGSPVLKNSDLPLSESGFVKINDHTQVIEYPNVFAVGDAASLEGPDWRAKQGHIAELMSVVAAHNIIEIEKDSQNLKGYQKHINILCIMDTGNGAAIVFRDAKKEILIPLPIVGHWLKKAWGIYAKWSIL